MGKSDGFGLLREILFMPKKRKWNIFGSQIILFEIFFKSFH